MFQDIQPHTLQNEYINVQPKSTDCVICFKNESVSVRIIGDSFSLPLVSEFEGEEFRFLFRLDGANVFGITDAKSLPSDVFYIGLRKAMQIKEREIAFALMCALHILRWYNDNKLCSRCGAPLVHRENERALICPQCNKTLYPTLTPAVIVAVLNNNKILFSKYAHGEYSHYALLAGFAEFGETIEQTCHREVLEEVGLKIKNLRYYKSQPWALSSSLLMGFYCEVDGDDTITLDENELSAAQWFDVDNLPTLDGNTNSSLTREMMENAKNYITK